MQLIRDSMSAGVVVGKRDSFISSLSKIIWNSFLDFAIFSLNLAATLVKQLLERFAIN